MLITTLVVAVVYLITKKPSIVDQVVIVTVPSGAEIKLNAKSYGNSPVKLEQVRVGIYTLTISKEGYETIEEQVNIAETPQLEFKLKLLTPAEVAGLSSEERIKKYQDKITEALASGRYILPRDNSAYHWTELLLGEDPTNPFALDTRETIRKRLLQAAQAAIGRGDLGDAKETLNYLLEFYQKDGEILAAANRLEAQLTTKRGEVRDWIRKAEEALQAGVLLEPLHASAYHFIKQALAIEPQNPHALGIRNEIKNAVLNLAEQTKERGDIEGAIRQLQQAALTFDDKQIRQRIGELQAFKAAEYAKVNDAEWRRRQGLDKHGRGDYSGAIGDLEFAITNDKGTADVIFALGHSLYQLGRLDQAATYLHQVPREAGEQYISARALLGEIAARRNDLNTALEFYQEARRLGGSNLYLPVRLDDLIERIEKHQQEKAAAPTPLAIRVKHDHGALRGSCSGTLTVDGAGVRYDGEDSFSANLVGVNAYVGKNELKLGFQNKSMTFKVATAEAERFKSALIKYQTAAAQK